GSHGPCAVDCTSTAYKISNHHERDLGLIGFITLNISSSIAPICCCAQDVLMAQGVATLVKLVLSAIPIYHLIEGFSLEGSRYVQEAINKESWILDIRGNITHIAFSEFFLIRDLMDSFFSYAFTKKIATTLEAGSITNLHTKSKIGVVT
ncbi:hypothetical protein ACJX0J_023502, partial [Zea mays]